MCTTLSKFKTLLNQAKSTLSKYPTYPALMPLTSPYLAYWSPHSTIISSYKHSWGAFKASTLPCWPFLPISSSHSPCDMCHTLIGWEEAQSMCSPLIQSEPSLSLHLSSHLDRWSLKPLPINWIPSQAISSTIFHAKLSCHFESPSHSKQPYNAKLRASKLPICYYPIILNPSFHHPTSIEAFGSYWAHIPNPIQ